MQFNQRNQFNSDLMQTQIRHRKMTKKWQLSNEKYTQIIHIHIYIKNLEFKA